MKKILMLLLMALPLVSLAQVKKPTKKVAVQKPAPTVTERAEKWFREVYAEKFFKDPYSYKLLKLTSEKINTKQALLDSLSYLTAEIDKCKIAEKNRNEIGRKGWQDGYDKIYLDIKKEEEKLKTEKDAGNIELSNKLISINKEFAIKYLTALKEYDLYFLHANEKKRVQERLLSITPQQEAELAFYRVNIDCYSKNSIGNEVLGKFQFPFTEKGTIGSGDGTSNVVHLNKE